jgi:glycosyltransferase involved in cell wall biosynthesis
MTRVLYVYARRNTFTRIDREILADEFELEEYYQPGPLPRPIELIRKLRDCDVVFGWAASWHTLFALSAAAVMRRPSVLVIGGFDTAAVAEIGYGNQLGRVRRQRARLAIARASRLVTNSRFSLEEIGRTLGLGPDRVRVIYHGLSDRFAGVDLSRRERLALTVGVVYHENLLRKGHLPFVQAASELPEVRFVLAGKIQDDSGAELREMAAPNVELTGWLEDDELDALFRGAAVYVQASVHEGFGLSLAEAMLAGAVPVVTEAGALPEVVGPTGVRISEPSPEALAEGVRKAIELGSEGGRAARDRILAEFPLEARRDGLLAEVKAAARGQRGPL